MSPSIEDASVAQWYWLRTLNPRTCHLTVGHSKGLSWEPHLGNLQWWCSAGPGFLGFCKATWRTSFSSSSLDSTTRVCLWLSSFAFFCSVGELFPPVLCFRPPASKPIWNHNRSMYYLLLNHIDCSHRQDRDKANNCLQVAACLKHKKANHRWPVWLQSDVWPDYQSLSFHQIHATPTNSVRSQAGRSRVRLEVAFLKLRQSHWRERLGEEHKKWFINLSCLAGSKRHHVRFLLILSNNTIWHQVLINVQAAAGTVQLCKSTTG